MLLKTDAIVLKTMKYRETSVISVFFTREEGMLTVFANGVRKDKAKMHASLFQPPMLLETILYYKPNGDMHRIKELKSGVPLFSLFENLKKTAIVQFMAELIQKSTREKGPNPALFDFIKKSLMELESTEKINSLYPLHFMLKLTSFLGIGPDLQRESSGYFDLREGILVSSQPTHSHYLDEESSAFMKMVFNVSTGDLDSIKLPVETKRELLNHLTTYYLIHIDGMKPLRSPEILKTILSK